MLQRAAAHIPFHLHHHTTAAAAQDDDENGTPSDHGARGLTRSSTAVSSRLSADPHLPASIPPWVHIIDNNSTENERGAPPILQPVAPIIPNTHYNRAPPEHYRRGRKWDHYRDAEASLLSVPIAVSQQRWRTFMQAGPDEQRLQVGTGSRIVSQQWLEENVPIAGRQWRESDELSPEAHEKTPAGFKGIMYRGTWLISPERQERTVKFLWRLLLKNPFVPLAFRLTILAFSAAGLGVATNIYNYARHVDVNPVNNDQCQIPPSTYMGIAVGSVAIPYIGYVTWDEYMAKPLGLRSVAAKILLLLCDLFFIVFSASNVSLAFSALLDRSWACYDVRTERVGSGAGAVIDLPQTCPNNPTICQHQRAFAGVLLVSLIVWMMTFSLSVLRVVEKLRPD